MILEHKTKQWLRMRDLFARNLTISLSRIPRTKAGSFYDYYHASRKSFSWLER